MYHLSSQNNLPLNLLSLTLNEKLFLWHAIKYILILLWKFVIKAMSAFVDYFIAVNKFHRIQRHIGYIARIVVPLLNATLAHYLRMLPKIYQSFGNNLGFWGFGVLGFWILLLCLVACSLVLSFFFVLLWMLSVLRLVVACSALDVVDVVSVGPFVSCCRHSRYSC